VLYVLYYIVILYCYITLLSYIILLSRIIQNIGKGSYWCIDPDYRPTLLQALRKTPYHPYHQLQMMSVSPLN